MHARRSNNTRQAAILAGLWVLAGGALAQVKSEKAVTDESAVAACRVDVARFERAIGIVRQSAGNEMANRIRESLLPTKVQQQILMTEGYCGLAKYMHEHKLLDKLK